MTADKNRKRHVREVANRLGVKYTRAARVVAAQDAGQLPRRLPSDIAPPDPVLAEALIVAELGITEWEHTGVTVPVAAADLLPLLSTTEEALADLAPYAVESLHEAVTGPLAERASDDSVHLDRGFVEALADLCAAMAGERLTGIEEEMAGGAIFSEWLAAWVDGGGALHAALAGTARGSQVQSAEALRGRLASIVAEVSSPGPPRPA